MSKFIISIVTTLAAIPAYTCTISPLGYSAMAVKSTLDYILKSDKVDQMAMIESAEMRATNVRVKFKKENACIVSEFAVAVSPSCSMSVRPVSQSECK